MSQQPEAIRLAAVCDLGHPLEDDVALIGPELRRLHAVESGAKVELMRRDNLIDSLNGLCESYRTQVESLQAEVNEQARLNGMGAERELALMAKVEILQAASVEWSPAYTRGPARQSAPVAAVPAPYSDATPHLHVGESSFEPWYEGYALSAPVHQSKKQQARDAYAAGMGDPLVMAAVPAMVPMHSEAVGELAEKYAYRDFTSDYPQTVDDLVRDVEARHGIGPTVGDGGAEE